MLLSSFVTLCGGWLTLLLWFLGTAERGRKGHGNSHLHILDRSSSSSSSIVIAVAVRQCMDGIPTTLTMTGSRSPGSGIHGQHCFGLVTFTAVLPCCQCCIAIMPSCRHQYCRGCVLALFYTLAPLLLYCSLYRNASCMCNLQSAMLYCNAVLLSSSSYSHHP